MCQLTFNKIDDKVGKEKGGVGMAQTKKEKVIGPIALLREKLFEMKEKSGMSYNQMARLSNRLYNTDISPYRIRSVVNPEFTEGKGVESLDEHINAVLQIFAMTKEEFLYNVAKELDVNNDWMIPEIRKFVEDKENMEYIYAAYKKAARDKKTKK